MPVLLPIIKASVMPMQINSFKLWHF